MACEKNTKVTFSTKPCSPNGLRGVVGKTILQCNGLRKTIEGLSKIVNNMSNTQAFRSAGLGRRKTVWKFVAGLWVCGQKSNVFKNVSFIVINFKFS